MFRSYDRSAIGKRQAELLDACREMLPNAGRGVMRLVLKQFQWNVQEAAAHLISYPQTVAEILQVDSLEEIHSSFLKPSAVVDALCDICFDGGELLELACGHPACQECWKDLVCSSINRNQISVRCMGCRSSFLEDKQIAILLEPRLRKIFVTLAADAFASGNPSLRFCPFAGCSGVVEMLETGHYSECVCCAVCENTFCFRCLGEGHEPCSCAARKAFLARMENAEEDPSEALLNKTTVACPNCGIRVAKMSGCHHLTCANCEFHFCWVCGEKFGSGPRGGSDGYGTHSCARQVGLKDVTLLDRTMDDSEFRFQWFMERYFIFHRKLEHSSSVRLSSEFAHVQAQLKDKLFTKNAVSTLEAAGLLICNAYIEAYHRYSNGTIMGLDVFAFRLDALIEATASLARIEEWVESRDALQLLGDNANRLRIIDLTKGVRKEMAALVAASADTLDSSTGNQQKMGRRGKLGKSKK